MNPVDREVHSYSGQRQKMVGEQIADRGIKDLRILEAMNRQQVMANVMTPSASQRWSSGVTASRLMPGAGMNAPKR